MNTRYADDIIAWAEQQAALLRAGRWSQLDIDNIAEEIEDVGKSEKRELHSRLSVLVAHLIKWRYQPARRGHSWLNTIQLQRAMIEEDLKACPSLRPLLHDPQRLAQVYRHARLETTGQTRLQNLPVILPWPVEQILSDDFFPE